MLQILFSLFLLSSPSNHGVQFLAIVPCICNIVGQLADPILNTYMGPAVDNESSGQKCRLWQTCLCFW